MCVCVCVHIHTHTQYIQISYTLKHTILSILLILETKFLKNIYNFHLVFGGRKKASKPADSISKPRSYSGGFFPADKPRIKHGYIHTSNQEYGECSGSSQWSNSSLSTILWVFKSNQTTSKTQSNLTSHVSSNPTLKAEICWAIKVVTSHNCSEIRGRSRRHRIAFNSLYLFSSKSINYEANGEELYDFTRGATRQPPARGPLGFWCLSLCLCRSETSGRRGLHDA